MAAIVTATVAWQTCLGIKYLFSTMNNEYAAPIVVADYVKILLYGYASLLPRTQLPSSSEFKYGSTPLPTTPFVFNTLDPLTTHSRWLCQFTYDSLHLQYDLQSPSSNPHFNFWIRECLSPAFLRNTWIRVSHPQTTPFVTIQLHPPAPTFTISFVINMSMLLWT